MPSSRPVVSALRVTVSVLRVVVEARVMLFVLVLAVVLVVATVAVETPVVPMVGHPCLLQNLDSGNRLARLLAHAWCVKEAPLPVWEVLSVGYVQSSTHSSLPDECSGFRGVVNLPGVEGVRCGSKDSECSSGRHFLFLEALLGLSRVKRPRS